MSDIVFFIDHQKIIIWNNQESIIIDNHYVIDSFNSNRSNCRDEISIVHSSTVSSESVGDSKMRYVRSNIISYDHKCVLRTDHDRLLKYSRVTALNLLIWSCIIEKEEQYKSFYYFSRAYCKHNFIQYMDRWAYSVMSRWRLIIR